MYPASYSFERDASIMLLPGASPNAGCPMVSVGSSKLLLTGITSRFNADILGASAGPVDDGFDGAVC